MRYNYVWLLIRINKDRTPKIQCSCGNEYAALYDTTRCIGVFSTRRFLAEYKRNKGFKNTDTCKYVSVKMEVDPK